MSKALKLVEAILQGICNLPTEEGKVVKERTVYVEKQVIDYEKLAEAIVFAERKANESENDGQTRQKPGIWKAIKHISCGKSSDDGRYLVGPFAILVALLFRVLAFGELLGLMLLDIFAILNWDMFRLSPVNILAFIILLFTNLMAWLLFFLFLGAANDVETEKDKSVVLNAFSGVISLGALIVAIIALHHGL